MNVLHGEASRADCYEKHTGTDAATHPQLHLKSTIKIIKPKKAATFVAALDVGVELSSRAVASQVLSP